MREERKHNRPKIRTAMIQWFKSKNSMYRNNLTDSNNSKISRKSNSVSRSYCQHGRLRRSIFTILHSITGRVSQMPAMVGLCPICGLRSVGSVAVEYVLNLHFWDGTVGTYTFRGRSSRECYRIHDGIIEIYMISSTISYALDTVLIIDFSPHEINGDSPEVLAAKHIIAGDDKLK